MIRVRFPGDAFLRILHELRKILKAIVKAIIEALHDGFYFPGFYINLEELYEKEKR